MSLSRSSFVASPLSLSHRSPLSCCVRAREMTPVAVGVLTRCRHLSCVACSLRTSHQRIAPFPFLPLDCSRSRSQWRSPLRCECEWSGEGATSSNAVSVSVPCFRVWSLSLLLSSTPLTCAVCSDECRVCRVNSTRSTPSSPAAAALRFTVVCPCTRIDAVSSPRTLASV